MSSDSGVLLRGELAALSACRGPHSEATLQQILDDAGEEILFGPVAVSACWSPTEEEDYDSNDDGDAEDITNGNNRVRVSGKVVIASKHLLFWSDEQQQDDDDGAPPSPSTAAALSPSSAFDLKVDALCIDLHALTGLDQENNDDGMENDTPPSAIYIQISTDSSNEADDYGDEGDASLFELTLQPMPMESATNREEETERICRQLFDAISKMISLNPINPNSEDDPEQDDDGGEPFGGASGSWITGDDLDPAVSAMMMMMTTRNAQDSNNDDMIFAAASNPPPASEEERDAMLERLDNLLIVPPEFSIHGDNDGERDGQFEDADEDDHIL